MKKNLFGRAGAWFLAMTVMFSFGSKSMAQQKTTDKDLVGVWVMESMQFDGENKIECGTRYSQVKIYGANGEYACAEIVSAGGNGYQVLPHEYGTYTFKNGRYSEMGRPEGGPDALVMVDKNTFKGRWHNRSDVWKRSSMPDKLKNSILETCKMNRGAEMQKLIKEYIFK